MGLTGVLRGRRTLQVGVLTGALLIVLFFLALDTLGRPQDNRTVWVLTRSVVAGTRLDPSSTREERIPSTPDSNSFLTSPPGGRYAAHGLSPGDILRQDDVESTPLVAVPVKLSGYQAGSGDLVDIYSVEGGRATLVGRGMTVLNSTTIEVPASDEPLWIALFGSSATLVSARSNGTGVPEASSVTAADAARRLSVLAQPGAASSPAP